MATNFNLKDFRSTVTSIARNQYFLVRIPPIGNIQIMTALARSTEMPAVTHNTLAVPYRGLEMKIDDRPQFGDWSVNFLCDEAHGLRNLFIKWMSLAYNIQNLRAEKHDAYKSDSMSCSQLSTGGVVTSTVVFVGAWPTNVGAITFDQAGGNVQQFDVTFTYDYFVMNDLNGDLIASDLDINVDNNGVFSGLNITGLNINGVSFNQGMIAPASTVE